MNELPLLALRGITKTFPGVAANDHVDLEVFRGEVHALVGENGAGKSTLMKILYGFYRADSGEIRLEGKPVQIRSPQDARRLRIGMVFQDFVQVPALTVAENIALFLPDLPVDPGHDGAGRADRGDFRGATDSRWTPGRPVWRLSVGERQKVEILKLLLADARVLILDEPTRSLAPHEIDGLFRDLLQAAPRRVRGRLHHPQAEGSPGVRRPDHGDAPRQGGRHAAAVRRDRERPRLSHVRRRYS